MPSTGLAAVYAALATLYFMNGNYAEQLQVSSRAVELSVTLHDLPLLARSRGARALALAMLGQIQEAIAEYEKMLPLAEYQGNWEEAARLLEEAAVLAEQNKDLLLIRATKTAQAELDLWQGHPASAYERLQPFYDQSKKECQDLLHEYAGMFPISAIHSLPDARIS